MNRTVKAGAVAFGLVGLLLVVALAARGGHPGSDGHVTTRSVPATLQNSLVTLLAIVYVLLVVGVIVLFFRRRQSWQEPMESHWLKNFAKVMVLMLAATLLGYWVVTHTHFHRHQTQPQVVVGAPQQPRGGSRIGAGAVRSARFEWPVAAGLGAIVVLGAIAIFLARRRETPRPEDEEGFDAALVRVVEVSIDDLRREPDPRRAVVAAYASMERVLDSHGLPRSPAEAPLEYLTRILRDLDVRESAVETLTRLFEYARFSPHQIGPELKDDAIAALVSVRADLLAPESAAA